MIVYYVYKITLLCGKLKNCYYIGKRKSKISTQKLKYVIKSNNIFDIQNYIINNPYFDKYAGSGKIIQNYYKKYNKEYNKSFIKEIIKFSYSEEENSNNEISILGDLYLTDDKCINLMEGGNHTIILKGKNNPCYGKHLSSETKLKISKSLNKYYKYNDSSLKNINKTEDHKNKLSNSLKEYFKYNDNPFFNCHHNEKSNKSNSEKHKELWKDENYVNNVKNGMKKYWDTHNSTFKGKHHSEDTKEKLSKIFKGKPNLKNKGENNGMFGKPALNRKPILQLDCNNNIIKEYEYITKVKNDGFCVSNVLNVCKGKRKTSGGYKWKYKNIEIN